MAGEEHLRATYAVVPSSSDQEVCKVNSLDADSLLNTGSHDQGSKDVFLSHSKFDAGPVRELKRELESAALSVYLDEDDPLLNRENLSSLVERLTHNLDRCRLLVVFLSEHSARSRWVPWELGLSHGRVGRAAIYPYRVDVESLKREQEYLSLYPVLSPQKVVKQIKEMVLKAKAESVAPAPIKQANLLGQATCEKAEDFADPLVAYEWIFRGPFALYSAWIEGLFGTKKF
jgi:hypothetical protein